MNIKQIKQNIQKAINKLYKEDRFLLNNKVHERSVVHKLATYLPTTTIP